MAKRIEQSRRHGHHDAHWAGPLVAVGESPLPVDEPEEPVRIRPTLRLVGGTEVTPEPTDPFAPART